MYKKYNICNGVKFMNQDNLQEMYLNQTWRPNLSITGADGIPSIEAAGNVIRQSTTVRLSMRLPPNLDPKVATKLLEEKLTKNVPFNCKVTFKGGHEG